MGLLMLLKGVAFAASTDRFLGTGFDGYDQIKVVKLCDHEWFSGAAADGYDISREGLVDIAYVEWAVASRTNATFHIVGGHTNTVYSMLAFNSNLTNPAVALYQVSNTNSFTFTETNALASTGRRFYRVAENVAGVVSTQYWVYTVLNKPLDVGAWNKYAMGINYGASNKLDSTLGFQLAQGLNSNNASASADMFHMLDSHGNWQICYLDGNEAWREYPSGSLTNTQVSSWQSFWIKRKSGGSTANPFYSGYCFTTASPMTFRSKLMLNRKWANGQLLRCTYPYHELWPVSRRVVTLGEV